MLVSRGHVVRGTTRSPARRHQIEAAGAEAAIADPDRVATLGLALERVTIACLLLGSAVGAPEQLATLHGARLEMLLQRLVDTPVRALVYEAQGSVEDAVLAGGTERVRAFCEEAHIPYALLAADPGDHGSWTGAAAAAVERALGTR